VSLLPIIFADFSGLENIYHVAAMYMHKDNPKTEWKWFAEHWRDLCDHASILKPLAMREFSSLFQQYVLQYRHFIVGL